MFRFMFVFSRPKNKLQLPFVKTVLNFIVVFTLSFVYFNFNNI